MLKPGGRAGIQAITIANARFQDYRVNTDFIQQFIFPGGMLLSPEVLARQATQAELKIIDNFEFGRDYAETLRRWRADFETQLPVIRQQGFDEAFLRIWRFYYTYCEAGFDSDRTGVCQVVMQRAAK